MVIWFIHPFQSILINWFLECDVPLTVSLWPLPFAWFMDLTHSPRFTYYLYSIGPCFCLQSHHNWVLFCFDSSLHFLQVLYSSDIQTFSWSFTTNWVPLQYLSFAFSALFVRVLKGKDIQVVCHSTSVDHIHNMNLSYMTSPSLRVSPITLWTPSFIKVNTLDKACGPCSIRQLVFVIMVSVCFLRASSSFPSYLGFCCLRT